MCNRRLRRVLSLKLFFPSFNLKSTRSAFSPDFPPHTVQWEGAFYFVTKKRMVAPKIWIIRKAPSQFLSLLIEFQANAWGLMHV